MDLRPDTFGVTVRRWRDRLDPRDVGLPVRRSRRTTGLRREDLADLAGVSVDYLVRLEQGRASSPSAQVVATLARALQLRGPERDHLYVLAGLLPPSDGLVPTHVPPGVSRVLALLDGLPVAVFTARWDLLSWSPQWPALLGESDTTRPEPPNLVRATFGAERDRQLVARWPVRAVDGHAGLEVALVADLRHAAAAYPGDRVLAGLIADSRESSARFAELWDSGAVGVHVSARKTVEHPVVGDVTVDCDVLSVPGSDVKLVVYSAAAGTVDADRLDFLRVAGPVGAVPTPRSDR